MVEFLIVAAAFGLLVLGIVGSVAPLIPGAGLSIAGVYLYWWASGYTDPSGLFVAGVTVVGVAAMVTDYFAGAISARAGGASLVTTTLAAAVGILLFFVVGPVGVIVGVAATVFAAEIYRTGSTEQGAKSALYATAGMLGSTFVQLLVTVSILVAFALAVAL